MIRFIHTADWQMGMKASGLGTASDAVRDARLTSLKRLVELANEKEDGEEGDTASIHDHVSAKEKGLERLLNPAHGEHVADQVLDHRRLPYHLHHLGELGQVGLG